MVKLTAGCGGLFLRVPGIWEWLEREGEGRGKIFVGLAAVAADATTEGWAKV